MSAVEWTDEEREAAANAIYEGEGRPADDMLDALAPHVAAREAQAAAKALREAAVAYLAEFGTWGGAGQGAWLRERADHIEQGDS